MNPRLLGYYNRELQHLREMGGEFAREFPKIASRLGLDEFACADPYVERLLEGFAFMAARVQLKLDAEFPQFTQHLLEMVYPHYLSPTPSMAVCELQPNLSEGDLAEGYVVPRGTALKSVLGKGEQTACEYRTAHDVTLWPLELVEVKYSPHAGDLSELDLPGRQRVKSALRFRLRATAGLTCDKVALERLPFYLRGITELPMRIYELLMAHSVGLLVQPAKSPAAWREVVQGSPVRRVGFADEEALLPYGPRSFQGYRLLHEYFAFPERFMFVELQGLRQGMRRCSEDSIDVIVLLDQSDPTLETEIDKSRFAMFCTPALNLFPKRADRIHLTEREFEYHVVPDRNRPLDFEVYAIDDVVGHGTGTDARRAFAPFYAFDNRAHDDGGRSYYMARRASRALSTRERSQGGRSRYIGSELFVSLVDADRAPIATDLKQLAVNTLCTNRDLPLQLAVGRGQTDFTLESGAPVVRVKCLSGPSKPRPSWVEGDTTWRLISHLSLNYLSLIHGQGPENAGALRELLLLYGNEADPVTRAQIEGVQSVVPSPVLRKLPMEGPITFGRGIQVKLLLDEEAFQGTGVFLLGAVLELFFARYVSINCFTETVVESVGRGEIMRWPIRIGSRHTL